MLGRAALVGCAVLIGFLPVLPASPAWATPAPGRVSTQVTALPPTAPVGTPAAVAARGAAAGRGQVVVIGIAGLRWDDVSPTATPAIAALAARGATGVLSVKARPAVSCPADGWLTLGAGSRAQAYGVARDPCDASLPPVTPQVVRRNAATADEVHLGALRDALGGAVAIDGVGAALASATDGSATAGGDGSAASSGSALRPPLRLVDAGTVDRRQLGVSLTAADAVVRREVDALPATADLLVVGLAEGPGEREARLHVALGAGPAFPPGALVSASTRRAPYVQLIDVAPTVLGLLGLPVPGIMAGQPWQVRAGRPARAALVDLDRKAVAQKRATVPFFVALIAVQLVLLASLRRRAGPLRLVALTGTAAPGASYLANLLPWWRAHPPLLALLAVVLALSLLAAAAVRRTRHPVGLLCTGTLLVLVADLVTGARLQMSSVAGYSALVAGRFAGLGNVAFGVYATAALLATASLAPARPRRSTAAWVAAAGLAAVAVDGAPPWGSDVGGVLALLPAFVVLCLLLTGTRVSVVRLLLAGVTGVVVVAAFALADYARPVTSRTHLGRFVQQVRDGTAGAVLSRKAAAVLGLLFHSPVTAALPLVVAAAVLLVLRPPAPLRAALARTPCYRSALVAVGVMAALGFAVNDSGAAVVALALLLLAPATVAVAVATAGAGGTSTGGAAAGAGARRAAGQRDGAAGARRAAGQRDPPSA